MLHVLRTAALIAPPILVAIILHELAHGIVAKWCGDDTAQRAGRLTLNPIAHIDLFGSIILPFSLALAGLPVFGRAKPVPVNFRNLRNPKRDMIAVALAGPVTNIMLAVISAVAAHLLVAMGAKLPMRMAVLSVQINIVLAVFNLLPVPPLDGSRVLFGLLPREPAIALARLEPYGMLIVVALLFTGALDVVLVPVANFMINTLMTNTWL